MRSFQGIRKGWTGPVQRYVTPSRIYIRVDMIVIICMKKVRWAFTIIGARVFRNWNIAPIISPALWYRPPAIITMHTIPLPRDSPSPGASAPLSFSPPLVVINFLTCSVVNSSGKKSKLLIPPLRGYFAFILHFCECLCERLLKSQYFKEQSINTSEDYSWIIHCHARIRA